MSDRPAWRVELSRRAVKDVDSLTPKLRERLRDILHFQLAVDPRCGKRLVGDLEGYWSLRLTYKDRIVYRIDDETRTVYVLRARSHCEV